MWNVNFRRERISLHLSALSSLLLRRGLDQKAKFHLKISRQARKPIVPSSLEPFQQQALEHLMKIMLNSVVSGSCPAYLSARKKKKKKLLSLLQPSCSNQKLKHPHNVSELFFKPGLMLKKKVLKLSIWLLLIIQFCSQGKGDSFLTPAVINLCPEA